MSVNSTFSTRWPWRLLLHGRQIMLALLVLVSFITWPKVDAQCPHNCNKVGSCDKYGSCSCSGTYTGGDCSLRTCPFGNAWADMPTGIDMAHAPAECSAQGTCNRVNGQCVCRPGFIGAACEFLECPSACSGAGRCMTLQNYASRFRNVNSQQYIYNAVWDAQKTQGCVCDRTRIGYDCSQFVCPSGDDPLTKGQVNECTSTCLHIQQHIHLQLPHLSHGVLCLYNIPIPCGICYQHTVYYPLYDNSHLHVTSYLLFFFLLLFLLLLLLLLLLLPLPPQVNEIQLLKCQADTGSFVLYYRGYPSATIPFNANQQAVTNAVLTTPGGPIHLDIPYPYSNTHIFAFYPIIHLLLSTLSHLNTHRLVSPRLVSSANIVPYRYLPSQA